MTQVYKLSRMEMAARALVHAGEANPVKHLRRDDIPKIRKLRSIGKRPLEIFEVLNIDMSFHTFLARCKELGITFPRQRVVGEAISPDDSCRTDWDRRATASLELDESGGGVRAVGPLEAEQINRVKAAKRALYGQLRPKFELRPVQSLTEHHFLTEQPCARDSDWVHAMRRDTIDSRLAAIADEVTARGVIRIEDCIKASCLYFGIPKVHLIGDRRLREIVRARQAGMYVAKLLTSQSYPEIGRRFGNRDHTTVLHACRVVPKRMQEDPSYAHDIETIMRALRGH